MSSFDTGTHKIGLLLRLKARALANRLSQALEDAPLRVVATVVLIGVIWLGLMLLFDLIFTQFDKTPLEATVATPLIFNFFFVAMLALLTFSNAILAYGSLFGKDESVYLNTSPLTSLDIVTLKFFESLAMSSWSLVVLGLPLMFALAKETNDGLFHVLFVAFFIAFVPIPGALGLLLAYLSARYFPRKWIKPAAVVLGVLIAGFIFWGTRSLRMGDTETNIWLRDFLTRMSFVESAFLPNQWVAEGIDRALEGHWHDSGMYLLVTVTTAMFLSWFAVRTTAKNYLDALDLTYGQSGSTARTSSRFDAVPDAVFCYLPKTLRLMAAKDLRTFFRDPLQWSQLAILFGLLMLYLLNMPTLSLGIGGATWRMIGPFLNLCAMSLIIATFTCRFVFPLVSLEGHNLWMIGLLPIPKSHLLRAKFAFAMTVTIASSFGAMALAVYLLELHWQWALLHGVVIAAVCFGLCGFSVGLGARLPMFDQRNAARIANGLGGTTNLLVSLAMVALVLTAVGMATWRAQQAPPFRVPGQVPLLLCIGGATIAVLSGLGAMRIGARHFASIEV